MKNPKIKLIGILLMAGFICAVNAVSGDKEEELTNEKMIGKIYDFDFVQNSVVVSTDKKNIAYITEKFDMMHVVLNNKEKTDYDKVLAESIVFSPDSKHMVYIAREEDNMFVVLDDKEKNKYEYILEKSIRFSPDSQHLAYVVRKLDKYMVVLDEKEGKEFEGIDEQSIIFSPDSQHLVYIAKQWENSVVVIDDEVRKEYIDIIDVDKKTGKKIVFDSTNTLHYLAIQVNNNICLVEETVE